MRGARKAASPLPRAAMLDQTTARDDLDGMVTVIDSTARGLRHPEKQSRPDTPALKKPDWLRVRAPGSGPWSRDGPDDHGRGLTHDARRGGVVLAWQTANPDLRMGGPSWGWRAAFADAEEGAQAAAPRIKAPVLMLQPDKGLAPARALCRRLPHCTVQGLGPAGPALQLEVDQVRHVWLSAVVGFIEADIARFSPPPPGARLAPEG